MSSAEQPVVGRTVYLHRREAVIRPGRVDVRPARGAVVAPLIALLIGLGSGCAIWLGLGTLPLWLLGALLVIAIVAIPLAGLGTVYALVGAHVVVDPAKQSATWQQGFLGMGVGTTELVPFWKIDRMVVEEAGASDTDDGQPVEEIAQFKIVLVKTSGKRLDVGVASAIQSQREEAFDRAWTVASAIAEMTGTPCEVYVPPDLEADDDADPGEQQERGLSDPQSRKPLIQTAADDVDSDEASGEAAGRSPGVRA
jgi:hypothetical protein